MLSPLEKWLPEFDLHEYHECVLSCTPEEAIAALGEVPVAPDPIVRTLFLLRGLGAGGASLASFGRKAPFLSLEVGPRAFVFGIAGRIWGDRAFAKNADEWKSWSEKGIRVAADFWARPTDNGRTILSTETRIRLLDAKSGRVFRAYWFFVGPFSAWIRRRWLRAISRHLEGTGARRVGS